MSTYFSDLGISSCEIGGLVAESLLHDLCVNNFTFTNFPEVIIEWDENNFFIKLRAHDYTTEPEPFTYEEVKALLKKFNAKKPFDKSFFNKIQKLAVQLESLVGKSRDNA